VTITELLPPGYRVDGVFVWSIDALPGGGFETTSHELPAGTTTIEGSIDAGKLGCVAIFYNVPEELAALGDFVFEDLDADGIQDAGEPGVPGVAVNLLDPGADGECDTGNEIVLDTTVTDAAGLYLFDGLAAGEYCVEFVLPDGFGFTLQDQLPPDNDGDGDGFTDSNDNCPAWPNPDQLDTDGNDQGDACECGDQNGDGTVDINDLIAINAAIFDPSLATPLCDTNEDDICNIQDLLGVNSKIFGEPAFCSRFPSSGPGQGAGDAIDSDANPATGQTGNISLDPGETDLTNDAGLIRPAALGDFVFEDCNGNGIQDDAAIPGCSFGAGIPGVPVELLLPGDDGDCGTGDEQLLATTATDADGLYLFSELSSGEYCVEFPASPAEALECPAGSSASYTTKNAPGSAAANDSNANPDGTTDLVDLAPGEEDLTIDAGVLCSVALGDTLWNDRDRDGIQDGLNQSGGEPGINGVTVTLFDCAGNPVGAPTTTGPAPAGAAPPQFPGGAGWYQFDGLVPGCYVVQFDRPTGFVFSAANQGGDPALDSNAGPDGVTAPIELISGQSDQTIDAGVNQPPAGLGDFVFEDRNADGIQDPGEPGIPDVPVILLTNPDGDADCSSGDEQLVATTTTDGMGAYAFEGLDPTDYCVEFDKSVVDCTTDDFPLGSPTFSPQQQGADRATDSNPDPETGVSDNVNLAPEEFDPTIDAGIFCPAKLGNRVFEDLNGDGIQDPEEDGISGVTVELFDCEGQPILDSETGQQVTRVTDSEGFYMFGAEPGIFDLAPGEYVARFDPTSFPDGFSFSPVGQGGDDALDSDCRPPDGETQCTPLGSRGINLDRDCGLIPPDCELVLDKKCRVEVPPPPVFTGSCKGKIQEFTLIWNGSGPIDLQGLNGLTTDFSSADPGDEVTFFGPGGTNDVFVDISGSVQGQSTFHLSCSDDDMDADTESNAQQLQVSPAGQDCGKFQGDGKNKDGFINEWLLEGLVDADGAVLDCTAPDDGEFADRCEFVRPEVSCETVGKPDRFTFRYLGEGPVSDCTDNAASRANDKPPVCSGNLPVGATVTVSSPDADVSVSTVEPGQTFSITGFGSQTEIVLSGGGGTESDDFHTSCSAPLQVGDVFGNLRLVAFDELRATATVTYRYEVTNLGALVTGIEVTDDQLGSIGSIPALPAGDGSTSAVLTAVTEIAETTTNTATAVGQLAGGAVCAAPSDSVTVEVVPPPIPPGSCDIDKPTALLFEYTGDSCGATTNFQEGKFQCSPAGLVLGDLASVVMTKDADKITASIPSPTSILIQRTDDLGKELPSDIKFDITDAGGQTQSLVLHTSCSKVLEVGDQFGSVLLVEFFPKGVLP
jgi:hypothetical protein